MLEKPSNGNESFRLSREGGKTIGAQKLQLKFSRRQFKGIENFQTKEIYRVILDDVFTTRCQKIVNVIFGKISS